MRLVILAAGRGTRMGEITKHKPKCLLEFGGMTLLEHAIDAFFECEPTGDGKVAVVGGHKAVDVFKITNDHYKGSRPPTADRNLFFYNNEKYGVTGAAHSLMCAKDFWVGHDCIIMEGDILFHPSIMEELIDCSFPNCIPVDTRRYPSFGEETIAVMDGNMVAGLIWPAALMSIGEAVVLAKVAASRTYAVLDELPYHQEIIAPLYEVGGFHFHPVEVPWIEIDTPEDLERARGLYQTGGFK